MSNTHNPGLLFYKQYYKGFDFELLLDKQRKKQMEEEWKKKPKKNPFYGPNEKLFDFQPPASHPFVPFSQNFNLETTYPGLLLGTGYPHGSGVLGEFKIGFYFDYTTGLPTIPGSSVKGVLRSAFPLAYQEKSEILRRKEKISEADQWANLADSHREFIKTLIESLGLKADEKPHFIERLEREIFEGLVGKDGNKGEHHFPMSQRDIFHDAIAFAANGEGLFADDYITPHKNTKKDGIPDEMKNPTPIQLLKVLPKVTFQFQFDLKNTYLYGERREQHERLLKPEERLELFRQILLYLGVGAKTNVGYGQFESETSARATINVANASDINLPKTPDVQDLLPSQPTLNVSRLKKGDTVIGLFEKVVSGKPIFKIMNVTDLNCSVEFTGKVANDHEGKKFKLRIVDLPGKKGNPTKILVALVNALPLE